MQEILQRVTDLDTFGIEIMRGLVMEEMELYSYRDLRIILASLMIRVLHLMRLEIRKLRPD